MKFSLKHDLKAALQGSVPSVMAIAAQLHWYQTYKENTQTGIVERE